MPRKPPSENARKQAAAEKEWRPNDIPPYLGFDILTEIPIFAEDRLRLYDSGNPAVPTLAHFPPHGNGKTARPDLLYF